MGGQGTAGNSFVRATSSFSFPLYAASRLRLLFILQTREDKLPFSHAPVSASSTFHFPVTAWWLGRPGAYASNPIRYISPTLHDSQVVGTPEKPTLLLSNHPSSCKSHNLQLQTVPTKSNLEALPTQHTRLFVTPLLGRPVGRSLW